MYLASLIATTYGLTCYQCTGVNTCLSSDNVQTRTCLTGSASCTVSICK